VPTWRASKDVTQPCDIIEEIVRIVGYDKITPAVPKVDVVPVVQPARKLLINRLKDLMANAYGCVEVHTYLWSETPSALRVVNSCIAGCDYIRRVLAESLISVVEKNRANVDDIRIFEVGVVFNKDEERHLGICIPDYRELAQILREVFGAKFKIGAANEKFLHPKNNAAVIIDGKVVGFVGVVAEKNCAVAEINLPADMNLGAGRGFGAVSRYQKSRLDFTFETTKQYGDVEDIFERFSHPLAMGFRLKDVFEKSPVDGAGIVRYTIEFTVGDTEKTLTAADINDIWAKVIAHGKRAGLSIEMSQEKK
jgi:phenylalanyl-tRNA synthetase beta chain